MSADESTWETRRKDELRFADERLALDPYGPQLVDAIATWFNQLLDDMPSSTGRNLLLHRPGGTATLADALLAAGLSDWAQDVEALVSAESPVREIGALSAERAIGVALGIVVGREPDDRSFDFASVMRQHFHDADGPFWTSAQEALAANPNASTKLQALVERRANDFTRDPRRTGYIAGATNPGELVENYLNHARFRDVWCNSPYSAQIFLRNTAAYGLLLQLDPRAWLDSVELFPTPEPVAEIVRQSCHFQTYDGLAYLIGNASSPFGANGQWRREHKVVFQLFQAAESLLLRLSGPVSDGGDSVGFQETLQAIVAAFGARRDASLLGHAWLEEIAWKDYTVRQWHANGAEGAVFEPLLQLFDAIAAVTPPLKSPLHWIKGDDDVWRRDRLLSVIAVLKARAQAVEIGDLLKEVAKEGLATSTADFIEDRQTVPCALIGGAIVALADPAAWLRDLWSATFPLRDRARHLSDTSGKQRIDMNITCTVWGVAALCMSSPGTAEARNIWLQTMEMIRETEITKVLDTDTHIAKGQRLLALLWQQIFPVAPQGNLPGSLRYFLSSFAAPNLHYMNILLTLEGSGVKQADIVSAAGGRTALRQLVSVVLDDTKRESQRGRPNANAEAHLEAFLNRL